MALANHPLWPFPANWTGAVNETLEWLTDIMTSPTGAEQRRALRPYPRRTVDFDVALFNTERAYADNLLETYGGGRWWLPLWHEPYLPAPTINAGATSIIIPTPNKIQWDAAVIWVSPFECRLVEVRNATSTRIVLDNPLPKSFTNAVVYPAVVAQITDQPRFTKVNDSTWTGEMRFELHDEDPKTLAAPVANSYLGFPVLSLAPNESDRLDVSYERMLETLDNKTAHPVYLDTAGRPFPLCKYSWMITGRQATRDFEAFLKGLCGRAKPIWVPTFHQDFEVVSVAGNILTVRNCGYVQTGGPRREKQYLCVQTLTGPVYRRITATSVSGGNEVLTLTGSIPGGASPDQIIQVSFMSLMRLNSDTLQLEHLTDTDGTLTCEAIFRSAPDLRVASTGF